MPQRKIIDDQLHAHFVTFSCYHRRRLLDHDQTKQVVLNTLAQELTKHEAACIGFVLMPDHAHALLWFPQPNQLSLFIKIWKQRSSIQIKKRLKAQSPSYATHTVTTEPVWQRKYYSFNIYSNRKINEKLEYMHNNPVRAKLVATPTAWPWSSARHYELNEPVGLQIEYIS